MQIRFGPFELDPDAEELRRGGLNVHLPRQPLRILLLLIRRAGEVVTREEIQAATWDSDTYVDFEHGINSAIRQIRFALGDQAEMPRYVRTLPRRGYSFIGKVESLAAAPLSNAPEALPPPVQSSGRAAALHRAAPIAVLFVLLTAIAALIAESRQPAGKPATVAVLPFQRLGTGFDERSFTEELRAKIANLPRDHVSLVAAGARADIVVGGTIRKADDGVRVIVSFTDAATQTQAWSETFERRQARREGMEVEVAHRVTTELARRFLPPPRREPLLLTKVPDEALTLYRRARLLHSRTQAYDWMRTRQLYESAVKAEPRFAEAWSGLSDVWVTQMLAGPPADRAHAAVRAADCARRAIALQPRSAEAHSTLGVIAAQRDFDLAAAEDALRRAMAADPAYVDGRLNLSMVLAMRGQREESLREFAVAQQLDPVELDISAVEPMLYLHARRYEDAAARFREVLAVNPESQVAFWGLMFTHAARRSWAEAIALARTLPQCPPSEDIPMTQDGFLQLYRGFGESMDGGRRRGLFNDYFFALYHAQIGDRDRAFELLEKAIEDRVPSVSYIMVDPRIDNLRGDPRFNAALARLKLGRPPDR